MVLAHRLSWELANGPIPPGQCVLHSCDNPPCVRLSHLFLGTQADDVADMVAKGRQASNLTTAQVLEIRRRRATGETCAALAAAFVVSKETISKIARRRTWAHLSATGAAPAIRNASGLAVATLI